MTWEYTGDPASSSKDAVRFLMNDTDETDPLVQDEEIDWLIATYGTTTLAAANGLQALANRYARQVTKQVGDLRLQLSDKAAMFREAAAKLFTEATGSSSAVPAVAPYVGGLSVSERITDDEDTDLIQGEFGVGMHDSSPSARRTHGTTTNTG